MRQVDGYAVAVNAAGLADALRLCQSNDSDGDNRLACLSETFGGWTGVVHEIARAAEYMEAYRSLRGPRAAWGGELPFIYDAWDAVGRALWEHLGTSEVQGIVARGIAQAWLVHSD